MRSGSLTTLAAKVPAVVAVSVRPDYPPAGESGAVEEVKDGRASAVVDGGLGDAQLDQDAGYLLLDGALADPEPAAYTASDGPRAIGRRSPPDPLVAASGPGWQAGRSPVSRCVDYR